MQVWRTRKGIYRKKHFPDVRDVNTGDGLMELYSGEVHMRDERGSSVSLCHLCQ